MSHAPLRGLFEEIHELVAESLSGNISDESRLRLETLVCEDPVARRLYLTYLLDCSGLRWWAGEQPEHQPVAARPALSFAELWLNLKQRVRGFATSAGFLWLLLGILATAVEVAVILILIAPQAGPRNGSDSSPSTGDLAAAPVVDDDETPAAVVPVGRLIRAVDCRWLVEPGPRVGGELEQGSDLWLSAGYAEIEFRSGARVLLQGPAWMTPDSTFGGYLHQGRLTARVPQEAKGFTIGTPSGKVIDLGTEFGVHVDAEGLATVHVFHGQVEAVPSMPDAKSSTNSRVLLLAGQSAQLDRGVKLLEGTEVGTTLGSFVRWLPEQGRFPLFATGRGLEQGAIDPHWQIAHESNPAEFKPARVAQPNPAWLPNDHYSSQWISLADGEQPLPGGRYTFRTQFDLSEFDAAKARIVGRWMADNQVLEIRLNGKVVAQDLKESGFNEFLQFTIGEGFAPGQNTVEFVVQNEPGNNPMGLRIEWYGMAEKKAAAIPQSSTPTEESQ